MSSCEICPILKTHNDGQDVQVFETVHWRGVLDKNQRSLGKMFITLLEHRESMADLSEEQAAELFIVMRGLEHAINQAYRPTHFNWLCLMNNAIRDGQPTHVHWHLHPRYGGQRKVGGEVFYDGVKDKTPHVVSPEVLGQIRDDICNTKALEGIDVELSTSDGLGGR